MIQFIIQRLHYCHPFVQQAFAYAGFAFVYFDDERDVEDAIRGLDDTPFGHSRRRISVEWSRQGERGPRHREGSRVIANTTPTKTLFVINFDPVHTRIRDIERHFEPYGNILHVRLWQNFAFVQFETQEEATKALECTHMGLVAMFSPILSSLILTFIYVLLALNIVPLAC